MQKTRIALYKYKFRADKNFNSKRSLDYRTPEVLLEFNWPFRSSYPSFLEVDLGFVNKSDTIIERKHYSRAPWEKEMGFRKLVDPDKPEDSD